MEYALIKRYLARSSAPYLPRLTRASVHGKAESQPKGNDEPVNVGASFPDDFEDSPLKSEILKRRNKNPGVEESYHPTMEEIYDSVRGKIPVGKKQSAKPAKEPEREPELDEM
ncbi:hypothetical protein N7499_008097 [Penicillium canescens]|uniref:Uncharacterized protein n=1 Tax=Penicillium canescens TaxID=5083 RepID=A0AAD6N1X7_PENCN|nr:uncharacterized protein N7446_013132 [Penicillium canescens]KAJ5985615.1 hypothetical protein N7522_012811 [Penicillium canescens]KAJ6022780.1 hypothetical protein N7460_013175 [Penicillium canescens]KAJ6025957.1 hypothetical protein N7444_013636 [Penicillium canescens]KAJ6042066.1 hypothetical protein N7446_013132 [Penicillium canescens]KAJ6076116.1 hypothetical protein N7499_008097 [Penicillium canescens]